MTTIEDAIVAGLPGTGRQIADRVAARSDVPNAASVTPNVVYSVLMSRRYKRLTRRKLIPGERGMLINYFERRDDLYHQSPGSWGDAGRTAR